MYLNIDIAPLRRLARSGVGLVWCPVPSGVPTVNQQPNLTTFRLTRKAHTQKLVGPVGTIGSAIGTSTRPDLWL
jgi:hypothetical protein